MDTNTSAPFPMPLSNQAATKAVLQCPSPLALLTHHHPLAAAAAAGARPCPGHPQYQVEEICILEVKSTQSMPRSKEMGQQRQSTKGGRRMSSSSDSNGAQRLIQDRSPKLDEHRRSPRSPLPETKKVMRMADLESRLGLAQVELKKLKEQLASAEDAKREAVKELEETRKQNECVEEKGEAEGNGEIVEEEEVVVVVPESSGSDPQEKEKGCGIEDGQGSENDLLKKRIEEAEAKGEELSLKLASKEEELERSRAEATQLQEQVGVLMKAREELEMEMRKLKLQTEQWRKAANAAAAIISGENGFGGVALEGEKAGEGLASLPEVAADGVRRRSSGVGAGGIRMLGELWKRKGLLQHK